MSLNVVCLTFCDPEDALRLMDERLNDPLVPLLPLLSMLSTFSCPPPSSSSVSLCPPVCFSVLLSPPVCFSVPLCPPLCSCFLMSSLSYFLHLTSVSLSLHMCRLLCLLSLFLSPPVLSSLSPLSCPFILLSVLSSAL